MDIHMNIFVYLILQLKMHCSALAGVAQWIEHRPTNRKVPGSIPGQGTCQSGLGPQLGHAKGNLSMLLLHIDASLPLFLPPFPSF